MPLIHIKNNTYSYNKLSEIEISTDSDFINSTLTFCKKWIDKTNSFTIKTSGSTGKPKKITLDRSQLKLSAKLTLEYLQLSSSDHFLVCLNTKVVAGIMMLVRAMETNATITVINPQGNPLKLLASDTTCNFTALVPLQLENILSSKNEKDLAILNNMKAVLIGGGPVNIELQKQIENLECPVYHTYGMTETVSHIALKKLNKPDKSDYFQTLPGIEIKTDERGCLMIKAVVTQNKWISTNDRVELVDQKQFKWLGRIDFVINSGGIKIQAEVLEQKLDKLFKQNGIYNLFFITGLPDKKLGETVSLVIEGEFPSDINLELFKKHLQQVCEKYEAPRKYFFVEKFDFTTSGKVDRKAIIQRLPD